MDQSVAKKRIRLRHQKNNGEPITERKQRKSNVQYYLPIDYNERIKVCQRMFMATFALSQCTVLTVARKSNIHGELMESDLRSKPQKLTA